MLLAVFTLFSFGLHAQIIKDPTTWSYEVKKETADHYELIFHLKIKEGWHIYAFDPGGDGSLLPPTFNFDKNANVVLKGKVKQHGKLISETLEGIDGVVNMYKNQVDYVQEITAKANTKITGKQEYQVCDDHMCLPPKKKNFTFEITDAVAATEATTTPAATADTAVVATSAAGTATVTDTTITAGSNVATAAVQTNSGAATAEVKTAGVAPDAAATPGSNSLEGKSLWMILLLCFVGGLASVITPCVFSMIPVTVGFFLKQSEKKADGVRNAIYYSLSIIIIFTIIGLVISALLGKNAPNFIATNWIVNIIFFAIFVIFGASFLGAFELTLPSSWTSKTDSKANTKSFSGIFFMALTLVIVSFSCTGPIVGSLLFSTAAAGRFVPALGMLAFSTGLALPFAVFAIFPEYLQKLGKSGGWLNAVKVVFGFIELALALKFLSNADLAKGWRLLDREIFIACWLVIFTLMTFYLLGFIKFSHDSELPKNVFGLPYLSVTRLTFAMISLGFVFYLMPGMWGAPLNGLGAFVPPMGTQDFVIGSGGGGGEGGGSASAPDNSGVHPVKYVQAMRIYEPEVVKKFGLVTYFDYDEALAASKKTGKPIMLDFTGINCVNCRKMETQVWSKPEVMQRLKNDFIIASLYCDYDKELLPKEERYHSKVLDSDVETVGDRNEDIQATKFGSNSQPYYFFVDENGNKLADNGYAYDPDVQKFVQHLDNVKAKFKASHP
ncbi:protein-disulfide reductase DsbD family protein [Taibaiella soli]|nr:thioredoxin family protein [Taibaiella soli]